MTTGNGKIQKQEEETFPSSKSPEYGGCASCLGSHSSLDFGAGVHWRSILLLSFSGVVVLLLAGYHGGVRKVT